VSLNASLFFTSAGSDCETPQTTFDALNEEFHFQLDVCATRESAKCSEYLGVSDDALAVPWHGPAFMNPPYGRKIGKWLRKAYEESKLGITVVCLIPSRTDTAWWHDYVMKAREIRFIRGRLHFNGHRYGAPFPSVIVVFGAKP